MHLVGRYGRGGVMHLIGRYGRGGVIHLRGRPCTGDLSRHVVRYTEVVRGQGQGYSGALAGQSQLLTLVRIKIRVEVRVRPWLATTSSCTGIELRRRCCADDPLVYVLNRTKLGRVQVKVRARVSTDASTLSLKRPVLLLEGWAVGTRFLDISSK